jgi:hypothetical protein
MSQTIPPMMVATWPTHSGIDQLMVEDTCGTYCLCAPPLYARTPIPRGACSAASASAPSLHTPWYAHRELSGPATAFERVLKGHRRRSQVCRGCG